MSYGSLYSGTVSRLITLTNGQTTVACSGTVLTEEGLRALDTLAVGTGQVVKLASITDDETFELLRPWAGTTQTLIATWDIIRDAPSRLDQVDAASSMTQAAGFAALVNGQTRQFRVESEGNSPPVSPVDGKYYLAGSAPSGWPITVTAGDIVKRRLGSYGVITPEEGWLAVILATGAVKRFKSGAWGVAAVTAADVAFTPTGGVAATTVQAAIAEVDSEKVTKASGTTAGRLWRFTDTVGGLGQSQMSEDASGAILFPSTPTLASFTGTSAGAILIRGGSGTGEFNTISFATTGGNVAARIGAAIGGSGSSLHFGISNNYGSGITHNVMTVRYDQRVGINTTAPGASLDVRGPAGSTVLQVSDGTYGTFGLSFSATYGIEFGSVAGSPINFKSNNIIGITIATTGYVGMVGATNPVAPLQVGSTATRPNPGGGYLVQTYGQGNSYWLLGANSLFNSAVHFGDPDSNTVGKIEYVHNGDRMEFHTGGAERGRFAANGFAVMLGSDPLCALDVGGAVAHRMAALTLVNTDNHNVARPSSSSLRVGGPAVNFTISGLTGGTDGLECELVNTTAFTMTLTNESASSTAGNRIATDTGGNITCKVAVLRYDPTAARWRVISFRT